MERSARDHDGLILRNIDIRQVRDECKIVSLDVRTQQQGSHVPQGEYELGEVAAAAEKDAMLAEAERFDVAVAVEDGEAFTVFQYSRSLLGGRRSGGYVVLLGGANFVLLIFLSVIVIDSGCGLMI